MKQQQTTHSGRYLEPHRDGLLYEIDAFIEEHADTEQELDTNADLYRLSVGTFYRNQRGLKGLLNPDSEPASAEQCIDAAEQIHKRYAECRSYIKT